MIPGMDALVERAVGERASITIDLAAFRAHVERVVEASSVETAHAGDLLVAFAAASGERAAIALIEQDHLARVREVAASVEGAADRVEELTQLLRERLFVGDAESGPRLLTYSGRGSLGAWIRVMTTRLALDRARARKVDVLGGRRAGDDFEVADAIDPELEYLKDAYGGLVNEAFKAAIGALEDEGRAMLAMHYVDGVSLERLATMFSVSRATAARRLADLRERVITDVRAEIASSLAARPDEAESLLALVRSRLDLSLSRVLQS